MTVPALETAPPAVGPPRVLLAPVTVTPAKPLTPSHLKGVFWTDIMYRATRALADVAYRSSHSTYDVCEQTAAFWEYLDRTLGDTDYSACSEEDIGELYVRYRAEGERTPYAAWRPYVEAVERSGWLHPASARVLELWRGHYARLGLHDPGLAEHQPPGLGLEEMIDRLGTLGMCLDLRGHGGPVYLDGTRHGIPLRQIVAPDGRANYLACALRELLPLAPAYDEVVLLYDRGLEPDYLLLQRTLELLGTAVHRVGLGRVPIEGRIRSARHGDWRGHTTAALLAAVADCPEPVVRLGMRLYFVAMLGPGDRESFRGDLLRRCLGRAERLLARRTPPGEVTEALRRHRGEHRYVDPYRLTSGLLAARPRGPVPELLAEVYT